MSTEVTGQDGCGYMGLSSHHAVTPDRMFVYLHNDPSKDIGVSRAEFLAAVAKECGVIIIDKSELPKVTTQLGAPSTAGGPWRSLVLDPKDTPDLLRSGALAHLALAEYLDAHPPVDEADVEALTAILADADLASGGWANVARHALSTGRIEVKK